MAILLSTINRGESLENEKVFLDVVDLLRRVVWRREPKVCVLVHWRWHVRATAHAGGVICQQGARH